MTPAAADVDTYVERWRAEVDRALERHLPPEAAEPATLHEAMRYSVFAGGKRLRPLVVLASADAVGGDPAEALGAACAVELLHTYSLIHDDLPSMDDDALRRGRPTSHVVFGEAVAILAGDALHSLAFEVLASSTPRREAVREMALDLARAAGSAGGMAGGQALDVGTAGAAPDEALVGRVHAWKTAALFGASARLGARAVGGPAASIRALDAFGRTLGVAFQIVDDVLDVVGTRDDLGKTPGKDAAGGKPTYVALVGVDEARARARALLREAQEHLRGLARPEILAALAERAVERDR